MPDAGSIYLAHMIDVSFTPFPFLTTENYTLRNLMPEDAQEIFALRSSDEINKYLDRPKAHTLDDASGKFQERKGRRKSALSCFRKITAKESCRK